MQRSAEGTGSLVVMYCVRRGQDLKFWTGKILGVQDKLLLTAGGNQWRSLLFCHFVLAHMSWSVLKIGVEDMQYNSRIIYFQDYCQCNQRALKTERDWLTLCEYCNNRMIILKIKCSNALQRYIFFGHFFGIKFFFINTVNNLFSNESLIINQLSNIFKKKI